MRWVGLAVQFMCRLSQRLRLRSGQGHWRRGVRFGAKALPSRPMQENFFDVQVRCEYLPRESDPAQAVYRFAYTIRIHNHGERAGQLIARHWWIRNGHGHVEQVRGLGVVGGQPFLEPGQSFEYTSMCQLATPKGSMRGHYLCVDEQGQVFECPIAEFVLDAGSPAGAVAKDLVIMAPAGQSRLLH